MKSATRQGFTLIEVLASMAVLALLVLALSQMFASAMQAFESSQSTVQRNAAARAALDMVARDLELAVVDGKLAFYHAADADELRSYDRLFMITMNGDQDDGRAYQQVYYYVKEERSDGIPKFRLMRATRDFDASPALRIDPLGARRDWWNEAYSKSGRFPEVVIENVVRFDVFVHDENSGIVAARGDPYFNGAKHYDSRFLTGTLGANTAAPYIDVYLQVASEDAMKRADLARESADQEVAEKGFTQLYQNSSVLFTRVVPIMGYAERTHPLSY